MVAAVLIIGDGDILWILIVIYASVIAGTFEMPMCMVRSKSERHLRLSKLKYLLTEAKSRWRIKLSSHDKTGLERWNAGSR